MPQKTGIGRGWWKSFGYNLFARTLRRRKSFFFNVVTRLFGVLVKDIANPNSILRILMRKLLINKTPSNKKNMNNKIDADFTIIEEKDYDQIQKKHKENNNK